MFVAFSGGARTAVFGGPREGAFNVVCYGLHVGRVESHGRRRGDGGAAGVVFDELGEFGLDLCGGSEVRRSVEDFEGLGELVVVEVLHDCSDVLLVSLVLLLLLGFPLARSRGGCLLGVEEKGVLSCAELLEASSDGFGV